MSPNKGSLTIVWGGQFGSEGKGQIAAHIAKTEGCDIAVRVGGPNAGHTFYAPESIGQTMKLSGNDVGLTLPAKVVVQSLPVPAAMGVAFGVIGPAGLIIEDLLGDELVKAYERNGRPVDLIIDANAAVITKEHMLIESTDLTDRIGSTGEGVGAATAEKVMRKTSITMGQRGNIPSSAWKSQPWGKGVSVLPNTQDMSNLGLRNGKNVMLEGTQGYGLSLHTGGFFPYCTSRECTPQALLAETGVGAHNAQRVNSIMVLRTFPIRVGGTSGPLKNEITWEELKSDTNGYVSVPERTTVTKKIRRIARFDEELVLRAIDQCGPSCIALNFIDYLFPEMANWHEFDRLPEPVMEYIGEMERRLQVPINYISYGPGKTTTLRSSVLL